MKRTSQLVALVGLTILILVFVAFFFPASWGLVAEQLKRFWAWSAHDPVAFYTAVLATVTTVLAAVACVQVVFLVRADRATTAAANENRATVARSMRAYLAVEPLDVEVISGGDVAQRVQGNVPLMTYPPDSLVWRLGVSITNTGSVPATDVRLTIDGQWKDTFFDAVDETVLKAVRVHELGTLAPKASMIQSQGFVRPIKPESIIFLVGELSFKDGINDQLRRTRFGFVFRVADRSAALPPGCTLYIAKSCAFRIEGWNTAD